jgi:curved DNA-binding protein CbpA
LQRLLTTLTLEATLVGVHKTDNARFMRVSLQDSGSGTETADNSSTAYKTFRDAVIVRLRDARRESASLPALVVDHLSVLGLRNFPAGVSQIDDGDVKKAYRKLALKHHPDKSVVGLPPWIDQSAVRKDADSVFKLVGEANAALCDSRKRAEYFANDRKATIRHGGGGRDDFGFGGSTFARDASRYGGRSGGSSGHGHGHQGWTGRESDTTGGGSAGESWGDWFSDANRARGRGAYKQRPKSGYKT